MMKYVHYSNVNSFQVLGVGLVGRADMPEQVEI
jgi:hypothetical protein